MDIKTKASFFSPLFYTHRTQKINLIAYQYAAHVENILYTLVLYTCEGVKLKNSIKRNM